MRYTIQYAVKSSNTAETKQQAPWCCTGAGQAWAAPKDVKKYSWYKQCFGSGFLSRIWLYSHSGSDSAKNPDPIRKKPDPWKKRRKTGVKYKYFTILSSTLNTVLFEQAPPKPLKPSFWSHKSINGRIRTFKTRIRNGKKTRIHPDLKH